MLRRTLTILVLLAVIGSAAWALWPRPIPVYTAVIGKQDIEILVEEEGKSRIRDVYAVSAPSAGQLLRVNLHPGDEVVGNMTIVASLKPADPALLDARTRMVLAAAAEASRAAVDFAAAETRQAEAQLSFLKWELQRATALVARGTISERAFEKAKLDVETAEAVLQSARASLLVRKSELERAEASLSETSAGKSTCCIDIRSPVSGRVLRVLTESEQVVQAGTSLVEIGDPSDIEIAAELLSRDAVRIKPGAKAIIDNWGGPPLHATVARIDPSAVTKISALGIEEQRVAVVMRLEGNPEAWASLGHGFRVVARISLWKGENLTAIPVGALFRKGADWLTYVIENGEAKLRRLELGARNGEAAEVKAGVALGETVILHPSDMVTDGAAIAVSGAN